MLESAALDAHLLDRLDPALMTSSRRLELVDLLVDVIAAEAVRYTQHELAQAGFCTVEEDRLLDLRASLRPAARCRPLGELYCLAWRSVANAKKQQRAPTATATSELVEQIETLAARAARDPDWWIRAFTSVSTLELAASTRVLFDVILDADPYTTTSAILDEHLPDPHAGVLPPRKITRSDFNSLNCAVCHTRVPPPQAWIWVDIRHAVTLSKTHPDHLDDVLERLARDDVTHSTWQIGHQDCLPADGASHDTALPTTYRELLGWAGDLLLNRRWTTHTDLPLILTEAATLTRRFAPAP
ncbi:hypothetical protein [Actinoalloteichus fjordicus]|uniref:Uncharacterized protein n=1 Tax=Actinoalloteichus fjordicus TaxID=1612552 RepID=A0AAC9PS74_9PSEU|nr:hypothetical protein [Actinoalloteichus fjordicus]APU15229.1 hypothetical protein UA74_15895 [Actinoalloteichus fjordicus]